MRHQLSQSTASVILTICLFSVSHTQAYAAPGNLGQIPLFIAPPTPPNIFFMLDDSGSMHWSMPSDGVSSSALITRNQYDTIPDFTQEWNVWCLGANLMAYDPAIEYKPWAANQPGTTIPFPDQTDLQNVWADPYTLGVGSIAFSNGTENENINGGDSGSATLVAAPVVTWTDNDNDGEYDVGECPTSFSDARVKRADSLSASEQINFANWFSYYRLREHATKAAVTQVVSTSSARMGMATLHHNRDVGKRVEDMTVAANKKALLADVVKFNSSGGTPLRQRLNWVGQYFDKQSPTPGDLNIGAAPSPILDAADGGECQQNFVMLMTDGQWNGLTPGVSHQDKTIDNTFVYPAHKDNQSETLADVAMKWYKKDLASALSNKVPIQTGTSTQNLDENEQQHLVTFGVAFGPTGTINSDPADRTQNFAWPAPSANADTTVDDLRHAAYNGRGKFLSASNPQSLISALQDVISDIESRQGSAAAISFNSTTLAAGTSLFFASFNTTNWTGDLGSFSIDPITGDIALSSTWSAASELDSRSNADMLGTRNMYTWGVDSSGNSNGTLFNWAVADPQPAMVILDDFKKNPDTTTDLSPFSESQKRLNFVRGNLSDDGTGLIRSRASRLGDIIDSAPFFVGKPVSNWPDSTVFGEAGRRYSDYQASLNNSPRQAVVYVGANDGILHGFNSDNGQEIFAYLPSAPASALDDSGLHYLSESDYQHRYYVDGSPVAADVYMRTEPTGSRAWRTVLVGGLNGGGRGLYALDVTDPSQFQNTQSAAENTVLWEFTSEDDADLGFTFSTPEVVMMNNNEWAVIFGNGYNATGSNTAKLMILFIEKGIDGQWTLNNDYIKIDTGVGTAISKNGLSTPALIDLNNDGKTDRIYAGDLHGNMWGFDVSSSDKNLWKIAHQDALLNPVPLFAAGNTKPITMKPLLIKIDNTWVEDRADNLPNMMVAFGTGQYIATGDAINTDQQTFYGIWDAGGGTVPSSKLIQQTVLSGFTTDVRVLSENSVNYADPPSAGDLGWFIDLPEAGERVTVNAFELAGLIFFNTLTPSSTACSAGGSSWRMAVDMKTGGNPTIVAIDINGDGILDDTDIVSDSSDPSATAKKAAGQRFGHGIASATAVITAESGRTFGYTSGTNSTKPIKDPLPSPDSGSGSLGVGGREAWIQLLN